MTVGAIIVAAASSGGGGNQTLQDVIMFVHIVATLGLFAAIGIELLSLARMRRAREVNQLREWNSATRVTYRLHMASTPLIVATGLYLMLTGEWGWTTAWTDVSLVVILCISASGLWVSSRRLAEVNDAAQPLPSGGIPLSLARRAGDPALYNIVMMQGVVAIGILYLMVLKPGLIGSLITIAVAAALGFVIAQLLRHTVATNASPALAD